MHPGFESCKTSSTYLETQSAVIICTLKCAELLPIFPRNTEINFGFKQKDLLFGLSLSSDMKERVRYEGIVRLFKLKNIIYRLNSNTKPTWCT